MRIHIICAKAIFLWENVWKNSPFDWAEKGAGDGNSLGDWLYDVKFVFKDSDGKIEGGSIFNLLQFCYGSESSWNMESGYE